MGQLEKQGTENWTGAVMGTGTGTETEDYYPTCTRDGRTCC